MSLFLSVVSRLLLISEPVFQAGLDLVSSAEGKPSSEVLSTITDVMCNKITYIVQPERKKLISIALLKLMSTGEPVSVALNLRTVILKAFLNFII